MGQEFVTVYTGPHTKAAFVKGLLESSGIPAHVQDEAMSTIHPVVGRARLQVAKVDVERARPFVEKFLDEERESAQSDSDLVSNWVGKRTKNTPANNALVWSLLIGFLLLLWFLCTR